MCAEEPNLLLEGFFLTAGTFMLFILIKGMISKRWLQLTDRQAFPVVIIANIASTIAAIILMIGYFASIGYLMRLNCSWFLIMDDYINDLLEYYTPYYYIEFPVLLAILFLPAYVTSVLIDRYIWSFGWRKYFEKKYLWKTAWLANALSYGGFIVLGSALFCVFFNANNNVREYRLSCRMGSPEMMTRMNANSNLPAQIKREITSPLFKSQIAAAIDVDESTLSNITVCVARQDELGEHPRISGTKISKKIFVAFDQYVSLRSEGHTPKYAFSSIRQKYHPVAMSRTDDRRIVFSKFSDIPSDWLVPDPKTNSQLKADGYHRFVVIDGEVAWKYQYKMKSDGSFEYYFDEKCDAIEYNPKLKFIYDEACEQAEEQLELIGKANQFGSCHLYWEYLKSILKEDYDISWQSPSELNPGICYD